METLLNLLSVYFSDEASLRYLVIGLITLAVVVLSIGIGFIVFGAADPIRRRLKSIGSSSTGGQGSPDMRNVGRLVNIDTIIGPVAQYILPADEIERNDMLAKLTHSGFRDPNSLQVFYSIKTVLSIGLPIITFLSLRFVPDMSDGNLLIWVLVASAVGIFLPNIVLNHFYKRRQKQLRDGFPDALDLLVVCIEAGLGLAQGIQRVSRELEVSHPELAAELSLVNAEVRVGVDRVQALKNLAARTGLEDIRGLVSLLVQTLRFGTSVADTLRVYSEEFRDKRMQKAEEMAAKIGTKMIFPLVVFMFPAFFVVAIGGSVMRLANAFAQMG